MRDLARLDDCRRYSLVSSRKNEGSRLTQQIQVTVELFPVTSIFSSVTPVPVGQALPTSLESGSFTLQQVIMENQGDALARRVDMTSHALSYPINFVQQEVQIPLANATSQSITLTGFRSGEVKAIECWITKGGDTSGAVKNPFRWYAPEDMIMTYAGEIYARFEKDSGALWNLVNGRIDPAANDVVLADGGGGVITASASLDRWLSLPFAQSYDALTAHSMYVSGKSISNGIVNLQFNLPQDLPASADLVLHVSYIYNAVLTFSQGTCDYVL